MSSVVLTSLAALWGASVVMAVSLCAAARDKLDG
jgi:hypothetical protein